VRTLHYVPPLAGVMGARADGCVRASGGHSCFGTNYVGHVVLTLLLLPALKRETPSRVIAVSSITHTLGANHQASFSS